MVVNDALIKIKLALEAQGLTQLALSQMTGIPQSTLSRSLRSPVRLTRTHRKVCTFLEIPILHTARDLAGAETLRQVVMEVWDGTDRHAQALARLLRAASRASEISRLGR